MNNSSVYGDSWEDPHYMRIWLSREMGWYKYVIFLILMFLSFFGNLLVAVTILMTRQLRSVTNYFLVNLTVADLLVVVTCMPVNLAQWIDAEVDYWSFLLSV